MKIEIDYFDRQGNPIPLLTWARLFEDTNYRRVAEELVNGVRISTVWLGLDHSFIEGKREIFESMVFGGEHDQEQRRYATLHDAIRGHDALVAREKEEA